MEFDRGVFRVPVYAYEVRRSRGADGGIFILKKTENGKLRVIALGGLEQIGMNMTAFEYGDSIIVVDCGMAFPEDDMFGVDLVVPRIT